VANVELCECNKVEMECLMTMRGKENFHFHIIIKHSIFPFPHIHNSTFATLLKRFPQIHEESMRSLPSPSIIDGDIGAGIFIEFDAQAEATGRSDGWKFPGVDIRKTFKIGKDYHAEQSVPRKLNPVFRFRIEHIVAPEPSLDISSSGIKCFIPARTGQHQVGRFSH